MSVMVEEFDESNIVDSEILVDADGNVVAEADLVETDFVTEDGDLGAEFDVVYTENLDA